MNEIVWTDAAYQSIVSTLRARTGLVFRATQRESIKAGIATAMKRSRVADSTEYAKLLAYDVEALDNLIVELTVGETYFFREPSQFEGIRREILPEILRRRGIEHRVRIWSAACASGEEPYSLAMVCDEEGLARRCEILATDISSEALAKARQGVYRDWSLRGERASAAKKYLSHVDGVNIVEERIRRLVRFEFLNLAMDVYPSHVTSTEALDLILCRNVLIYLGRSTICEVSERLYRCLAEGGWLITASGDPSVGEYAPFETVVTDFGVFYRKPAAATSDDSVTSATDKATEPLVPASSTTTLDLLSGRGVASQPLTRLEMNASVEVAAARAALGRGEYARAVELADLHPLDPAACVIQVKALANLSTDSAIKKCTMFVSRHPLVAELHYLHAVLLMELNLDVEAVQAAQRALFLDRSLELAHFLLGTILQRRGALEDARRSFRNARDLAKARQPDEVVPLSEHETASLLTRAAENHLRVIDAVRRGDE